MTPNAPGFGNRDSSTPTDRRGELRYHKGFESTLLGNRRTLAVYLPPGYASEPRRRYPVFYLHDGQNVFDAATAAFGVEWQADDTAERLILEGRIDPVILVGIYNTPHRIDEYTLHRDSKQRAGGKGKLYGRFVMEEVKPFIDRQYRTLPGREHTAVGGSSLGGLISLAMAKEQHEYLSMCAVMSPALWWDSGRLLRDLGRSKTWLRDIRFWVDMGTREGDARRQPPAGIRLIRRLGRCFRAARLVPERDNRYWEVEGGEHNEANWAARFDKVLLYFFGKSDGDT
jgi:predicted alpha/beta superfamily hydrolase